MEEATPEIIKKNRKPPQNLDCKPMDYGMWDSFKEIVYQVVQDKLTKQALMNRIITSWDEITIEEIHKSISAWKKRIRLVAEEDGDYIEHRLK